VTMFSISPAISNEGAKPEERRGSARQRLSHCVVLAFFGEDSWGRLVNISESGMAFEFSKPPSLREQVNFTFQVMGCMPLPEDASVLGESIEARGEILWLREFEREAGAQFVDLADKSRQQIRQWLSLETSANASSSRRVKPEAPPTLLELRAPLTPSAPAPQSLDKAETGKALTEVATSESPAQAAEPELPLTSISTDIVAPETPEAPALPDQSEVVLWQLRPKGLPQQHTSVARLTFLVVSGCLAAFTVTAGVRIFLARAAHRAEAVRRPTDSGGVVDLPPLASPSSAVPAAVSSVVPSAETAPAFQVEVQDVSGRRWMLWFVRKGSGNGGNRNVFNTTESPTVSTTRTTQQTEATSAETVSAPRTFTLIAPNLDRPAGNDSGASSLSAEAPAIQSESAAAPRDPMGNLLANQPAPPPVELPVGGMVQPARLIRSAPPVYPGVAKSNRVSGDVVMDALIDATGKVTTVKLISGPVLLQQAAIETVRQWKYEPARLDGQAVAMHLTVTVKFRLN